MKILLISPTLEGIGGVAQHTRDLVKFLQESNHNVDIISSENIPTIPIKKLKNPSFLLSSFIKTKFMKHYDIVHAQHPIAALAMKNITGKKILTIHGIYSNQIEMLHGKLGTTFSNKYEKNALTWADAITAGSMEAFNHYKKSNSNVFFIPNGIDVLEFSKIVNAKHLLFEKYNFTNDTKLIGFPSWFDQEFSGGFESLARSFIGRINIDHDLLAMSTTNCF